MALDYKSKYLDLRSKMLENIDVSYRLGYEEGFKEGQQSAQADAMQRQIEQQQATLNGGQPIDENGQPIPPEESAAMEGEVPPEEGEIPPEELQDETNASDLDAHIQELESLVQKGEKPSIVSMRKAVTKITNLRKNQKAKFKRNQSQVVSSQKKLVDSILKKWEDQANHDKESNEIDKIIKENGLELKD